MSVFDSRPKNSAKWPTFRGGILHDPDKGIEVNGEIRSRLGGQKLLSIRKMISELSNVIYVSLGSQLVCTTPNGGLGNGHRRDEYPVISFERCLWVQTKSESETQELIVPGPKKPLYIICWCGGYERGSIIHMGWQYPHCEKYDPNDLEKAAFLNYRDIAGIIYQGQTMDSEVRKFIS